MNQKLLSLSEFQSHLIRRADENSEFCKQLPPVLKQATSWNKGKFKIHLSRGGSDEVAGLIMGPIGIYKDHGYTITHIPSGIQFSSVSSQNKAKEIGEKLAAIPELRTGTFGKEPSLNTKVQERIKELFYKTATSPNVQNRSAAGHFRFVDGYPQYFTTDVIPEMSKFIEKNIGSVSDVYLNHQNHLSFTVESGTFIFGVTLDFRLAKNSVVFEGSVNTWKGMYGEDGKSLRRSFPVVKIEADYFDAAKGIGEKLARSVSSTITNIMNKF